MMNRPAEEFLVCVIGMWHLGLVTVACLADSGYKVVGVDHNPEKASALNSGRTPLFEPGLDELIGNHLKAGRLKFTSDLASAVKSASHVWIAFDTPVNDDDESDLSLLWSTVRELAPHLCERASVLISSQVPVGTCEQLWSTIQEVNLSARGGISYVPENLRLGLGIERFKRPDMLVIGANDALARSNTEQLLQMIEAPKIHASLRTAEMAKHAINAFLATNISLINELGNIGESLEVDTAKVGQIMRLDSRIGAHARLTPGLGFAGGTLARDLKSLQRLARSVNQESALVDAVLKVNSERNQMLVDMLQLLQPLEGASIGILGLTYTANTSTLRRSASLEIISIMQDRGAQIKAYDPEADLSELSSQPDFEVCADAHAAALNCDALILLTDWAEFKQLDFAQLGSLMRRRLLIDVKNLLEPTELMGLGFEYIGVGRGHLARYKRIVNI
jgi:UDPglucose 6-dehydrogenase